MPLRSGPEGITMATTSSFQSEGTTAVDERRNATRVRRGYPMKLTSLGCSGPQRCHAEDISECGLYVRVPADSGLAVGQRCELNFEKHTASPDLSKLAGETCYATVVRTNVFTDGPKPIVGAGLRFDQPLFL